MISCALGIAYFDTRLNTESEPIQVKTSSLDVKHQPKVIKTASIEEAKGRSPLHLETSEGDSHITLARAINNLECRLGVGYEEAQELAVITLPVGQEMDFAVLDQSGTRFLGWLPFKANHHRLGLRAEGSVLAGFAALRLSSKVFRPPDSQEPLRIYHDEPIIFESEKAWDFDIAPDGSSFVVHEPAPGGASRLIIRDLNRGKETHYDLGTRFTPMDEYEVSYALKYSLNYEEIMFEPAHADAWGIGKHLFYSVHGVKPRQVSVEGAISAIFADRATMYFADYVTPLVFGESTKP